MAEGKELSKNVLLCDLGSVVKAVTQILVSVIVTFGTVGRAWEDAAKGYCPPIGIGNTKQNSVERS